ncbi:hypothetical protein CEP52_016577 [Fusarium oligoseptatum]|uniref:Uncharacterized protein n=1 Tax=Fusarium oligoseptatum TaxID=2604345 RepID=A0A428S2A7_9HYPO|nr:hypothetical protein CEP52_016577 [Fusarium oligoseptatum]
MEEYAQYRQNLLHKTDDDLAAEREERYTRVGPDSTRRGGQNRGFEPPITSDYSRPRAYPRQRPPMPPSPSSARGFGERSAESVRKDPATPTPQRKESSSPYPRPYAAPSGSGGRPMSRGEFYDQEYHDQDYNRY